MRKDNTFTIRVATKELKDWKRMARRHKTSVTAMITAAMKMNLEQCSSHCMEQHP